MKIKILTLLCVTAFLMSCKKEEVEPVEPTPAVTTTDPADSTDTTTAAIDYGNDNDGMQPFPRFALKICGATSGQNVSSIVDSIVFSNYTKNYVKVKTALDIQNDQWLHWSNVTSPSNGNGIGYSIPEAIVGSNDSCNISVYMNEAQGQYGYSEMGFTQVNLISEGGGMVSPTVYSHTDYY